MSRKLSYFNVNGYTEAIRYMLHYGNVKFEDVRYDHSQWPIKEVKDSLPYGQLPIYEEDGRVLNQSIAIARYVASQTGLLPADLWEQAKLDAAVLNVYDLLKKFVAYYYESDPKKREDAKKTLEGDIVFFYSRFDKELKANGGHFGGKLSWADFILVGAVELLNLYMNDTLQTNYPAIAALVSEIHGYPGVKVYVSKREPYKPPQLE
uniref:glutathione transferase n=1 Tax=Ostrinia furnacalis TaxID=93504 RepID=A0A6C0WAV0_OSTFU|nr:glutathione S-transferase sigma 3 [Ostrinia furnacalis]